MEKKIGVPKSSRISLVRQCRKNLHPSWLQENRRHQRTSTLSSDRIARVKLGQ